MPDWESDDWEMGDPDTEASVFHDIEVGRTVRTQARTVTESDLTNFAGVSGDFNHLHTDEARMADSMFGERIAHGMFVFSAATGLIWQARSPEERASVVAFYGIDRVRFRAPVFVGDTIHVELEVVDVAPFGMVTVDTPAGEQSLPEDVAALIEVTDAEAEEPPGTDPAV